MNLSRLGLLELFYFSWFNNMRAARDARLATTRVRCWVFYTLGSCEVEVRFGESVTVTVFRQSADWPCNSRGTMRFFQIGKIIIRRDKIIETRVFSVLNLDSRHDLMK